APIALESAIVVSGTGDKPVITLQATNRYSFTDLSVLKTKWSLLRGEEELLSAVIQPKLAPRSFGTIRINLSKGIGDADRLRVSFMHPDGREVGTYEFALKPANAPAFVTAPKAVGDAVMFPRVNLITSKNVGNGMQWHDLV